jgi:hypothetical protein
MRTILLFLLVAGLHGQEKILKQLEVGKDAGWVDTGVELSAGDLIRVEAAGQLKFSDAAQPNGPEGLPRGWKDLMRVLQVNDAGRGALIGRVNQNEASRPFLIGPKLERRSPVAGRLFLAINRDGSSNSEGTFQVKVTLVEKVAPPKPYTGPLPKVTEDVLKKVPRRVVDPEGTPGDRVNFLVLGGTLEQVTETLISMGWVVVDKTVQESVLKGALGTLMGKEAYLTMPMSPLMVFDRVQDHGFAMSDPIKTVAERHHFRVWLAPFEVDGWPLIVGAGTHDVGFDKDQRNGKVTHKIDPDTDKERDFIGESLHHSGLVVKRDYVTPSDTLTKAKTAHGQEFFSDGRILVIYFRPAESGSKPAKPEGWAEGWGQKKQ